MRSFVESLAAYARATNPAFAIVPQNGSALVSDATYLAAISGQGGEDTWFRGDARQSRYQAQAVVPAFDLVRAAGKAVLLIDYPSRAARVADFFDRAEAKGYGAYNSTRALDRMTVHPGHPPSPGPTVTLASPADGASVSAGASPTFTWTATGAAAYELHFSGTRVLTKLRRVPRAKSEVLTATTHTPSARDWARIAREARKGDGVTVYWWVVAIDAGGARRSAPLRSLVLAP